MSVPAATQSLNPIQFMLLKLFSRPMDEQETKEIQDLLLRYLDAKVQQHAAEAIAEKGITQAMLDEQLNQSQRTKEKNASRN